MPLQRLSGHLKYVSSSISFDCWAEKPHLLTGEGCRGDREEEIRLWAEIITKPRRTGQDRQLFRASREGIHGAKDNTPRMTA